MPVRRLGDSAAFVSALGLGLAAVGRPGYINLGRDADLAHARDEAAMRRRAHAVLDAAFAAGVRYVDAARSYGRAEAFLGDWLATRGLGPGEIAVGSKWGYTYTAGWRVDAAVHEVKEHSLDVLRRQWRESRDALGRTPALYQIHSATLDSGVLEATDVLDELARIRAEGVAIGLTTSGPAQADVVRRATALERDGRRLFDVVQSTWNPLEPSAGPALAEAAAAGLGVIVKEAMANGRLAGRGDDPGFTGTLARVLRGEAERLGTTPDALVLAAALARPWAGVVLSGAATPGQVAANVAALAVLWDDAAERALAGLAEPPAQYWRTRAGLAWT